MTQIAKSRTTSTELRIIARVQFKENASAVLYGVQSGEKTYQVTVYDGRITGCAQASGEVCQGFRFRHSCKHTELVAKNEAERASDLRQHLADEATVHSCVSCGARVKKANSLCYDCCN